MLKVMRDNLKSLSWILGFVVLAFVFAVFADYGGQNNFTGGGGGSGWAAQVDGRSITEGDFYSAARNVDAYYRNLLGTAYDSQRFNLRIGQQAINQLVQEEVVMAHARSLGLGASKDEIAAELVRDPAFQGETGFIGVESYKNRLKQAGIDTGSYEEEISRRVVRRKWSELLTADVFVSEDDVREEVRRREESADIVYAHIRNDDFLTDLTVTDEDMESFYSENRDRYVRGEGRVFQTVTFDRLAVQDSLTVTEEEIRALYGASLQTRFTVPEQRRASHILIKTPQGASDADLQKARQAAEAALARVQGGEDFAAVAAEVTEDSNGHLGGDLGFFQKGIMALPFQQAVWAMNEIGELSGVVQTSFGFHVIKLTGKMDQRLRPFEEVREELESEARFEKAGRVVKDQAGEFAALAASNPDGFVDDAARRSLVAATTPAIYEGDALPGIGSNPEISRAFFAMSPGDVSEALPVPRGYVVARFLETRPGGAPPLEEIKEQVEADTRRDLARRRAAALAEKIEKATADADLKSLADKLEFTAQEASLVLRGQAIGSLGVRPELERTIFSGEPGRVHGPVELEDGLVFVEITSRELLDEGQVAEKAPDMRRQLLAGRKQQILQAVVRELTQAADVRYNTELIARIDIPPTASNAGQPPIAP